MTEFLITGISLGLALLWVLVPFRDYVLPYRRWVDLLLAAGLIYIVIVVKTNFVVGITTFTGLTISAGLRIWAKWHYRKSNTTHTGETQ